MQVTLIVLFAHWCPKCNMMMPVVDEIEEVYKEQLEVVRIDIEKETEIAKDYSIQIVPTFVIMKQGNEVMRMAGIIGEEILKKRIEAGLESRGMFTPVKPVGFAGKAKE